MATKKITCSEEIVTGIKFDKESLVIDDGNLINSEILSLKDFLEDFDSFSKSTLNLKAGKSLLFSEPSMVNNNGYVSFIIVKCIFPEIAESKKYIHWGYKGNIFNMGELMILSGTPKNFSENEGWIITRTTEEYDLGGITFINPHDDINVKLELLLCK